MAFCSGCCPQFSVSYGAHCSCALLQNQPVPPQFKFHEKTKSFLEKQEIFVQSKPEENIPRIVHGFFRPIKENYKNKASSYVPSVTTTIPSILVTLDAIGPYISSHSNLKLQNGKTIRDDLWMSDSRYYSENRGPILIIHGKETEWILTYKEYFQFDPNGDPMEAKLEDYSVFYPPVENLFIADQMETFTATSRCKQVKQMKLKNEGTAAVRYQILRCPPTRAMRKILGRPGSVVNLEKYEPPSDDPFFWKDTSFEFHFRELPGVILPGQSIMFTIIFRPRKPGYYHEKLYLLTHPRLTDEEDQIYSVKLSGICMDPECPLPHSQSQKTGKGSAPQMSPHKISQNLKNEMMGHEVGDILSSILDNVLYDFSLPKSTMPLGKITAEKIFYTHNQGLHYKFEAAEKGLETARDLASSLLPKSQIMDSEHICPLSIKELYFELTREPSATEYFWGNLKSPETEEKLEELANQTRVLTKQRVFAWPTVESRIYSSCYTTMVAIIYEIVARMANIDTNRNNEDLDNVLREEIKARIIHRRKKEGVAVEGVEVVVVGSSSNAGAGDSVKSKGSRKKTMSKPGSKDHKTLKNVPTKSRDNFVLMGESDGEFSGIEEIEMELEGEGWGFVDHTPTPKSTASRSAARSAARTATSPVDDLEMGKVTEEEILSELNGLKTKKEAQEKRVLFETLFGCGVERMMSVVDSYKAMYDYRGSDVIRPCQSKVCQRN